MKDRNSEHSEAQSADPTDLELAALRSRVGVGIHGLCSRVQAGNQAWPIRILKGRGRKPGKQCWLLQGS